MKHKRYMVLLVLLLVVGLTACKNTTELTLYYKQREVSYDGSGLIGGQEAYFVEPVTPQRVAEIYFKAETEEDLQSPFPENGTLVEAQLEDGVLCLQLSEEFGTLEGADLSLVMTCITMTFSQLSDVESVELSIENNLIQEQKSIRLSVDDVMVEDDGLSARDVVLTLYYADAYDRHLIPTELRTTMESVEERAKLAIEYLGMEPEDQTLRATLPKNTEVLDVSVSDGLCIVDFSSDFYRNRPTDEADERLTIFAIVNTLTEFDEIDEVQILIEGESRKEYRSMDLRYNFVRDETLIGPN